LNLDEFATKFRPLRLSPFSPQNLLRKNPLAFSLPQDSSRELMFDPCAKRGSGASASSHSNFATLRERRIGHACCRTSLNRFMRRLNPSRTDRRSMQVALKSLDLLDFSTTTTPQKPAKQLRSPQFGRDAPEVCRMTRRFRPVHAALNVTRPKSLNSRRFPPLP
jgi:hypothetical protein